MNGWKSPIALEPPPTQAISTSGRRPMVRGACCRDLAADDGLEIADHHRIGMGAERRAQQVVGRAHVGDPVPHRLVDGVLERAAAGLDRDDARAQQPHAEHVERLALDVLGAHVDFALEPQQGRRRRRGHPVLPGARLGDDALLAHARGQQALAQHVVDLVGPGVTEVLALEVDASAAHVLGEPARRSRAAWGGRRSRAAARPAPLEAPIAPRPLVGASPARGARVITRLGHEPTAEGAEVAVPVGQRARALRLHPPTRRTSATKRRTFSGSFRPGRASTPELTSTP